MTIRRRTVILALAALVGTPAGAALAQSDGHGGAPPTAVRVAAVRKEKLQDHRRVTGELRAVAHAEIATIEPGLVVARPVDEGSAVAKGDVIAVLDARRLRYEQMRLEAERAVAAATIDMRAAELEMEQTQLASLEALQSRGAANPKELADARSRRASAAARLAAARRDLDVIAARLELVGTRLDDMTVRAPFAGVVVGVLTEAGQWVGEGDALAEIVATGSYEAWIDVPQRFADVILARHLPVQVSVDAVDRPAIVAPPVVVPRVDPASRAFQVFVRFDDESGTMAPGMSVTGWVPSGREDVYATVPRDALLRNDVGFYVFAARTMGPGPAVATPVPITVLFDVEDRVAVRGGLEDGDLVVVEGNERLFPMMPLSFDEPQEVRGAPGPEASAQAPAGEAP